AVGMPRVHRAAAQARKAGRWMGHPPGRADRSPVESVSQSPAIRTGEPARLRVVCSAPLTAGEAPDLWRWALFARACALGPGSGARADPADLRPPPPGIPAPTRGSGAER